MLLLSHLLLLPKKSTLDLVVVEEKHKIRSLLIAHLLWTFFLAYIHTMDLSNNVQQEIIKNPNSSLSSGSDALQGQLVNDETKLNEMNEKKLREI